MNKHENNNTMAISQLLNITSVFLSMITILYKVDYLIIPATIFVALGMILFVKGRSE